jgi:hypothetical protein
MFSDYQKNKIIDNRNLPGQNSLSHSKAIDIQPKLPSESFIDFKKLQNVLIKKDETTKDGNLSFFMENDEDKENMEEIIASEKEVKREEMQNNINQYLDNSYLSQMYLGSVTVVGLFIMYRLIRRK